MADNDDEPLVLSSHALAALAEFQAAKDEHQQEFETLKANMAAKDEEGKLSMTAFVEDWNESQFWYSDESALLLADQLLDGADADTLIGVLSTPSVFVALKNRLRDRSPENRPKLVLFEHDRRFAVFPEFIFYDFQRPMSVPVELKASLDRLIVDPPFFSIECQSKFALTALYLVKPGVGAPVIVCTGERMASLITKCYRWAAVKPTTYEPHHEGLSNHYCCYANFECSSWKYQPLEEGQP